MKTLMFATWIRLALATAAAVTLLSSAVPAEEDGLLPADYLLPADNLNMQPVALPPGLFTNPQQFPPKPVPSWKQHSWELDNRLDWETATNAWRKSVMNPAQHLPSPLASEGLPVEDTFGPLGVPDAPAWSDPDLGVPTRPDQIFGLNQGNQNGYDNLDWVEELPPAPPTDTIPGVPFTFEPQHTATPPQEEQVDWGGLFGGVADSLKGVSHIAKPR